MVKLTVKTIKGKKFEVEVEPIQTVKEVKGVIEATDADFPAAQLKLIHSGKVLKDEVSFQEYNIKENDFIVCMVSKPKPAAPTPSPVAAPAPAPTQDAVAPAPATVSVVPAAAAAPAALPAGGAPLNEENVRQLCDMGFPDDQARAALRAAMGNAEVAVEFLMTGIPDNFQERMAQAVAGGTPSDAGPPTSPPGAMESLEDFRRHPQFNELKRLVQRDPASLQTVLQLIGQQSPRLLARIHENQEEFISLMNEPVEEAPPASVPPPPASGLGGLAPMMGAGMGNPAQMAQILQSLTPAQRAQWAASMGVSPEQLAQVSQVIGNMPPDQLQQLMNMVGGGGMGGGAMGAMGVPPMPSGAAGGANVIHLTEEEGAAVARLTELGFDRSDAAQAYLACDKNEALAANLLMDGMGSAMPIPAPMPVQAATTAPAPASTSTSAPSPATTTPPDNTANTTQATPTAPGTSEAPTPAQGDASGPAEGDAEGDEDMYG
ncbi:unnamed protein product [Choristocarpus tenellus]